MQELEELVVAGKKFSGLRRRLVLTQEELATQIEMSVANVRRIESAVTTTIRPKSFRNLARLAKMDHATLATELAPDSSNGEELEEVVRLATNLKLDPADVIARFRRIKGIETAADLARSPRQAASHSDAAQKRIDEKKKRRGQ